MMSSGSGPRDVSRLWEMPRLLWEAAYCWHIVRMYLTKSSVPRVCHVGDSSFAIKKPWVNLVWPIHNLLSLIFNIFFNWLNFIQGYFFYFYKFSVMHEPVGLLFCSDFVDWNLDFVFNICVCRNIYQGRFIWICILPCFLVYFKMMKLCWIG